MARRMLALTAMNAAADIRLTQPIDARAEPANARRKDLFFPGETLNGVYQIVSVIGSGGMGQVFEAHDLSLDRRVAIKAAWPTTTPGRLREEARALAAVKHPCMVAIYAMGRYRDIDYMAMERLYGIGLDEHIDQRKRAGELFRIDEVTELMRSLAEGLRAIHGAGLAHQDVKPENVMIAPAGRIVFLDLGIGVPEVNAGVEGRIEGSPVYMAPEMISQHMHPGSAHLGDLYALGLVSYELLTGNPPFDGTSVMDVWRQHLSTPAPDVRILRPDVPRVLAELISELLAKDPGERPQSAESVLWYLDSMRSRSPLRTHVEGFDILIVDDEPAILDAIRQLVHEGAPGANIRTAVDGEDALAMVRQRTPDILLTDLDLPRMNGIELCMHLRGMRTADHTTVVAVSGTADVHDRQLLRSLGITRFVGKEVEQLERLPALVRGLIAERS